MNLHRLAAPVIACVALAVTLGTATPSFAKGVFGGVSEYKETFCSGGCPIRVERFEPSCGGCYPAVIALHGAGGLEAHAKEYRYAARMLASLGYVVILPCYQQLTGVVPEDQHYEPDPAQFAVWMQTASDCVAYTACLPSVNPARIGLVGFSLGSFVALSTAAVNKQIVCVADLFGGLPDQYARLAKRFPPTIIIHGQCDDVVPVTEAFHTNKLLLTKKACVSMYIYPGEGHLLSEDARDDAMQKVICFLESNLK